MTMLTAIPMAPSPRVLVSPKNSALKADMLPTAAVLTAER
jgi:hypothetical protein